jgi:serine/threonine protein kinase
MTTERIGRRLGNYQVVQRLGRGGFAQVYLGQHVRLSTQAAIKVLLARLVGSEEVQHFEREARTIEQLRHPQIVRVLDFDVQDYASGGTLRQHRKKGCFLLTHLPLWTNDALG